MVRLLILLFTRRLGLIIIGLLLLIGGAIYGATSHQVAYQSVARGSIAHYLSDGTTGYLQMEGSPALYVINEHDFTPAINGTSTFADGDSISFIYRTDSTNDVDQTSTLGTHLVGKAYTVVQITAFASSSGQTAYTTSAYNQNPNGFYENNWLVGGGLLLVGLAIAGLAFVVSMVRGKNKAQPSYNAAAMEASMAAQPQANPYQQTYQNPGQYPQQPYQNPAQYPPQPGQYPPQPGQYPQYPQQPGQSPAQNPQYPQYPQQPGQ